MIKVKKTQKTEDFHFNNREISLYIALECLRNVAIKSSSLIHHGSFRDIFVLNVMIHLPIRCLPYSLSN